VLLFAISISPSSLVVCAPSHFTILSHGPISKQSYFLLLSDAILQLSMLFSRFFMMLGPDPPALHQSRSFSRFGPSFVLRPASFCGCGFADHDLAMSPLLSNHRRNAVSPRFSRLSSIRRVLNVQPVSSAVAAHHCRGWISGESCGRDMAPGVPVRLITSKRLLQAYMH
jgi:hypothetical protein